MGQVRGKVKGGIKSSGVNSEYSELRVSTTNYADKRI